MTERWLPVVGYEGAYEVSNEGRVRSLDRIDGQGRAWRGRILKACPVNKYGHLKVVLSDGKQATCHLVHHLVLNAFVGPCPPGEECRHLDGNPSRNALGNLSWGTHQLNVEDTARHGRTLRGSRNPAAKLSPQDVLAIRSDGRVQREIALDYAIAQTLVSQIKRGRRWSHI